MKFLKPVSHDCALRERENEIPLQRLDYIDDQNQPLRRLCSINRPIEVKKEKNINSSSLSPINIRHRRNYTRPKINDQHSVHWVFFHISFSETKQRNVRGYPQPFHKNLSNNDKDRKRVRERKRINLFNTLSGIYE